MLAEDSGDVRNSFHGDSEEVSHARVDVHFLREVWYAFRQVFWAPSMCRCLLWTGVVCTSVCMCVHAWYRMCVCSHVCAVCSFSVGERGWARSGSPYYGPPTDNPILTSRASVVQLVRASVWMKNAFIIAHKIALFATLKVKSFILTEVSDCGLLIVVTSSTLSKEKTC